METTKNFNHCTGAFGVWVEYNGLVYNDVYEAKLKDGSVVSPCIPQFVSETDPTVKSWLVVDVDFANNKVKQSETVLNDADIAEVAMLADDGQYRDLFTVRGQARQRKNAVHAMRYRLLRDDEDLDMIRPERCRAVSITLTCLSPKEDGGVLRTSLTPVVTCDGEKMELTEKGTWTYSKNVTFALNPRESTLPKPWRLLKQKGVELEFQALVDFEITETDNIGVTPITKYSVGTVKAGRLTEEEIKNVFSTGDFIIQAELRFKRIYKKEQTK